MTKRVWVTGHKGLVGSALLRRLETENVTIITSDFDLRDQSKTYQWIKDNRPDTVFMAAAKVGGIHANNTYPAEFIHDNITLQNNIIHGCHLADVNRLIFLGSSCIYPRDCVQPMSENALMSGELEPTNAPYAMAKLSGIEMVKSYARQYNRNYISVIPTNLYGENDNFHVDNAHVPAALLHRIHMAKINNEPTVTIWGSGTPFREFMHVDDMADACVFLAKNHHSSDPINIGTGNEISIKDLAVMLCDIIEYNGEIIFDTSKQDGTPRKFLDCSRLNDLGWHHKIDLHSGLKKIYEWYIKTASLRGL